MNLLTREPVLTVAVVEAALALLLAFGVGLDAGQVAAIVAFTTALLGLLVRQQVTPTSDPRLEHDPKV